MQSLTSQFFAFLVMVLIGLTVGVSFDIYNVTKKTIRRRRICVMIGDFFFWVISAINIIFLLLVGNWGEIRLYVIIGVAIGTLIYFRLLRKKVIKVLLYIMKMLIKILGFLLKVIHYVWLVIMFPFFLVKKIIVVPLGMIGNSFMQISSLLGKLAAKLVFVPIKRNISVVEKSARKYWASLLKR